jgi:hypothetical protein
LPLFCVKKNCHCTHFRCVFKKKFSNLHLLSSIWGSKGLPSLQWN